MTKLVIFDYDDTLIKSSDVLFTVNFNAAKDLGLVPATKEVFFSLWGKPHKEMVATMYPEVAFEEYLKSYNKAYDPELLKVFDDVKPVLTYLKDSGYKLAILSSKRISFLKDHLEKNGLIDFFEYIHGAESSEFNKPDPRVFDDILKHFGLDTDEVLYVGDQTSDFVVSKKADIDFIAVTTGINNEEDFEEIGCKKIIPDISKIKEFV